MNLLIEATFFLLQIIIPIIVGCTISCCRYPHRFCHRHSWPFRWMFWDLRNFGKHLERPPPRLPELPESPFGKSKGHPDWHSTTPWVTITIAAISSQRSPNGQHFLGSAKCPVQKWLPFFSEAKKNGFRHRKTQKKEKQSWSPTNFWSKWRVYIGVFFTCTNWIDWSKYRLYVNHDEQYVEVYIYIYIC